MKKLWFLTLALLLFSCGEKTVELPSQFDASVSISSGGTVYEASYEKRTDGDKLVLRSPEHLEGMEFHLKDGTCTVALGDISFESENFKAVFDFLPVSSECEKTVGDRVYRIYDLRGLE